MWVAFLVIMLATGETMVQAAPEPFVDEAACMNANAGVEKQVKEVSEVKAYALKCVEVKKEDTKRNGKDS